MGRSYHEFLEEKLHDPEFRIEWDKLEPEFQRIKEKIAEKNDMPLNSEMDDIG